MRGEGFWIAPDGEIIPIIEHLQAVEADSKMFGLTAEDVSPAPDEPLGQAGHSKRRERLLILAMKNGWLRVRQHGEESPKYTTFQSWMLDSSFVGRVRVFLKEKCYWETDHLKISILSEGMERFVDAKEILSGNALSFGTDGEKGGA